MVTDLDFADNLVIVAETGPGVRFGHTKHEIRALWTKDFWIETKIQMFFTLFDRNIDHSPPVTVQGENICFSDSFVYLGIAIGCGG